MDWQQSQQDKFWIVLKKYLAAAMGAFFIFISGCLFFADLFKIKPIMYYDNLQRYLFAGIFLLYGFYRIYMGFKTRL